MLGIGISVYLKAHLRPAIIPEINSQPAVTQNEPEQPKEVVMPLENSLERITKKPFGIHVTPTSSPVSPERFTGYHTGTDFEILPGEENADVTVSAICTGKILNKQTAQGYGGLLSQACVLGGQPVTVYYGHIKIAGVADKIGDTLSQGQAFAILGKAYSAETGGERKHLHLGIHKGEKIDNRGYVSKSSDLDNWLDFQQLVK